MNPDDCSSARLLLYSPHECGLGAELHWVTVALTIAYVTKRALVFREDLPWIYAERPFCADGQGTYSCYFRSLSKCTIRDASQYAALVDESAATGGIPTLVTTALDAHRDTRVVQYTDKLNEQLDFQFTRKVPDPWHMKLQSLRNGPSSLFWWRSQLLGYMWRFQPRVQRLFDERRRATLPPSLLHAGAPLIGMHSRSGDKVYGSGLQPAEMARIDAGRKLAFLNAAARQCATHLEPGAHAFAAAYVATKDPAVLAAAQRAAGDGQLDAVQLIWDASVHRYGQGFSTEDLVDGTLNGTREALDAMFDVEMLASCAGKQSLCFVIVLTLYISICIAFVGTFESNLSRLVMEIGACKFLYKSNLIDTPTFF